MSEEELDPIEVSNKYHKYYEGKFAVQSKVPIRKNKTSFDFSIWYTPGVAEPCRRINEDKEAIYDYTSKGNTVAVVSDGTRVLGLGDIGPEAGLPVMEGKALLFKYLGGVNAVPLCINAKEADNMIETVKRMQPTFGGINLEDIEKPKCFSVLNRLREELDIPVWHDDQQGTGLVSLAGLYGALELVGKKPQEIKLVIGGVGSAGLNNLKFTIMGGVKRKNIKVVDKKFGGILSPTKVDKDSYAYEWAEKTNPEGMEGGWEEALDGADVCISATAPGPGIIKKEWVGKMADDSIIFAMANPVPEIPPEDAKEAGAKVVGTGRSDYPNQVNNSLGFPAVFRGTLEVNATDITDEMCITAANSIADRAEELGLSEDSIIPSMEDKELYVKEAVAVAKKAVEQGVARKKLSEEELEERIREKITLPRESTQILMDEDIIPSRPIKTDDF